MTELRNSSSKIAPRCVRCSSRCLSHLFLVLFFVGCTAPAVSSGPDVDSSANFNPAIKTPVGADANRKRAAVFTPPWQLPLGFRNEGNKLDEGIERELVGQLQQAKQAYTDVATSSSSNAEKNEARLRRFGVMLKLGESNAVLKELSDFVQQNFADPSESPPALSLLMSCAYLHQGNIEQAIAWLGSGYRQSGGKGGAAKILERTAEYILSTLSASEFERMSEKWGADRFAHARFAAERLRRINATVRPASEYLKWFNPRTYTFGIDARAGEVTSDSVHTSRPVAAVPETVSIENQFVPYGDGQAPQGVRVGLLLPLSGENAGFAEEVRQGILLAFEELDPSNRPIVIESDTGSSANSVIEKFASLGKEGVKLVMGPLSVADAQQMARGSDSVRVPFLTFAKKRGIPQLGRNVLRLGVTSNDQAQALVSFTADALSAKSFGMLYPNTSSGIELAEAFRDQVRAYGRQMLAEVSYVPGDEDSIVKAVSRLSAQSFPEVIIVADDIGGALSVLESIAASPFAQVPLLAPASWDDPAMLRGVERLAPNLLFPSVFSSYSSDQVQIQFRRKFQVRFGKEPTLLSAQAYDAARFVAPILVENAGLGADDILKKLKTHTGEMEGITGSLHMNKDGDILRSMNVILMQSGKVYQVVHNGRKTGYWSNVQTRSQ